MAPQGFATGFRHRVSQQLQTQKLSYVQSYVTTVVNSAMVTHREVQAEGEQEPDLNVWEGVLQQLDGALSQAIWIEGLLSCLSLQVLRSLQSMQITQCTGSNQTAAVCSRACNCCSKHAVQMACDVCELSWHNYLLYCNGT